MALVMDSSRALDMPDGEYVIGPRRGPAVRTVQGRRRHHAGRQAALPPAWVGMDHCMRTFHRIDRLAAARRGASGEPQPGHDSGPPADARQHRPRQAGRPCRPRSRPERTAGLSRLATASFASDFTSPRCQQFTGDPHKKCRMQSGKRVCRLFCMRQNPWLSVCGGNVGRPFRPSAPCGRAGPARPTHLSLPRVQRRCRPGQGGHHVPMAKFAGVLFFRRRRA